MSRINAYGRCREAEHRSSEDARLSRDKHTELLGEDITPLGCTGSVQSRDVLLERGPFPDPCIGASGDEDLMRGCSWTYWFHVT